MTTTEDIWQDLKRFQENGRKPAHYQGAAREFLDDQVGSSDRTNATPKMASLTAS
jgi:hypothetical protein